MNTKYPGLLREAMINSNSPEEFIRYVRIKVAESQTTILDHNKFVLDLMYQRIREANIYSQDPTDIAVRTAVVNQLTNLRRLTKENAVAGDAEYIAQAEQSARLIMYVKWLIIRMTKKRRNGLAAISPMF